MSIFRYKAVNETGKTLKGFVKAESYADAVNFLTMRNFYILSISEMPRFLTPFISFLSRKIKNIYLIEFARNLSIMLKAGIPLVTALSDIAESIIKERFKRVVSDIASLIEKGISFSEAVSMHKEVFPPVVQYLIKIGEETGQLDRSLDEIANYFQRIEDLRTAIKRALIYPIFATVVSFGAVVFWLVYVLPKIVSAMKDMGVAIPFITQMLVKTGSFLSNSFYLLPFIPLIFFFSTSLFRRSERLRWIRDYFSLRLPIIKQIFYNRAVALFCEQMRILTAAGVPVDSAFDMTAEAVNNEQMKTAIKNAKEKIITGERIAQSLKEEKIFPGMVIRLIDIGETSGNLEEQFGFLNNYYTARLQEYSVRLGKILEPVVLLFIGVFFAIIFISLLGPIYDLITKLGR